MTSPIPFVEMLQLMKRSRCAIPSATELSYPIPQGSSNVDEVKKCLESRRLRLFASRNPMR
jgi:hypothetical protein